MRASINYVLFFSLACFLVALGWLIARFQYKHHSTYATTNTVSFAGLDVHLMHGTEHHGYALFPRRGSVIRAVSDRGDSIILYKCHQTFQESTPFVGSFSVVDGHLQWDDGKRQYSLSVLPKTDLTSH